MGYLWKRERDFRQRTESNQDALLENVKFYKTKDSLNVASIATLKLTLHEFKQADDKEISKLRNRIKTLNVRLRNIQAVATANTQTTGTFTGVLHDTTGGKMLVINRKFGDISLFMQRDTVKAKFVIRDRMTQVVYKERRGDNFWQRLRFWKKRRLRQDITFENPNTHITYPKYIEITNKRGK